MRVTNPKVGTLAPTWRRYRGLSVLFDPPAADVAPGVVALHDIPVTDAAASRLYDDLAGVVAETDPDGMRERYGFCPLPRHSYHVTVCDGPNEHDAVAVDVAGGIDALPGGAHALAASLGPLFRARVLTAIAANPVTLTATGVVIRGYVLAAALEPSGPAARGALDNVMRARQELSDDLRRELGLRVQRWRPHVSLGYFSNRGASDAAAAALRRWNAALAGGSRSTITFTGAAVYAFSDIVSFYRLGI